MHHVIIASMLLVHFSHLFARINFMIHSFLFISCMIKVYSMFILIHDNWFF